MKKFTVAILVNNQFGVLNRVTSMFRRRQFNITSLTVSETECLLKFLCIVRDDISLILCDKRNDKS